MDPSSEINFGREKIDNCFLNRSVKSMTAFQLINTTKMYNYFDSVCVDAGKGDQARLIRDLSQGYDRDAKPVKNASDAVTVKLTVTYNQLQDLVSI